jgi:hypothetical protein
MLRSLQSPRPPQQLDHAGLPGDTRGLGLAVGAFDKCTMVITVYDRHAHIRERLKHYQHLHSLLSGIVVIWNYVNVTAVSVRPGEYKVPVHVLTMPVNSMNNRFHPWPEINTSCVINMDDDWCF